MPSLKLCANLAADSRELYHHLEAALLEDKKHLKNNILNLVFGINQTKKCIMIKHVLPPGPLLFIPIPAS